MGHVIVCTNPQQVLTYYSTWSMILNPHLAQPITGGGGNKIICDNNY